MALTKRDHEAMASLISGQIPDLGNATTGDVWDEKGLRAVTRIAIGYMNHAFTSTRNFNGEKFIEWSGIGKWVQVHEGFATKEARWVPSFQLI